MNMFNKFVDVLLLIMMILSFLTGQYITGLLLLVLLSFIYMPSCIAPEAYNKAKYDRLEQKLRKKMEEMYGPDKTEKIFEFIKKYDEEVIQFANEQMEIERHYQDPGKNTNNDQLKLIC
jgi:hypothetical protein